jgi:ABC-type lipoprotein export system ATPase subunit
VTTRPEQLLPHPGHRPGVPTMVLLEGLSRRYQVGAAEVFALRDVDLEIDQGEFAVVLGPSGSGKSTLLNMIGALDSPTSGRAVVAGEEITAMDRRELFRFRREVVSFIFQTFNLFPTLTALENVQCGGEIAGSAREARRRAEDVLGQVGLGDRLHHYPSELSGGEQQRVAIARALVTESPIVVADEPTGRPRLPDRGPDPGAARGAGRCGPHRRRRDPQPGDLPHRRPGDRAVERPDRQRRAPGRRPRPDQRAALVAPWDRPSCSGGRCGTCVGGGPRWWSSP